MINDIIKTMVVSMLIYLFIIGPLHKKKLKFHFLLEDFY